MTSGSLTPEEFVRQFVVLKDSLVKGYLDAPEECAGAAAIAELNLRGEQRAALGAVLDSILKDALYTVLLALDGEAALDSGKLPYKLLDEQGNLVSGLLEGPAYEAFHEELATG